MKYLTRMTVERDNHRGTLQFAGKFTDLTYQTLVPAVNTIEKTYRCYVPHFPYKLQN